MAEFFRINRLTLNLSKTNFVNFGSPAAANNHNESIKIMGTDVQHVGSVKYLGLHIDRELNWSKHIDTVCARLSGTIGALRKLHFLPSKILRTLYYAIVHPHLEYASAIWTSARKTRVHKLQVLQRRAMKCCFKLKTRHPTLDLFLNVGKTILPLKALGTLQICTTVFTSLNNIATTNLEFHYDENRRSNRRPRTLATIRVNNDWGKNSISYRGPMAYASLSDEIRNSTTLSMFKRRMKNFLRERNVMTNYVY